jgi:drug/metabolite transporter (DMT)-like permease
MKNNKKDILVYLALTAVAFIIGFSFIYVKIALEYATTLDVLAYRFASAAVLLMLLAAFKVINLPKLSLKNLWPLLLLSLFYPILFFGLQTIGLVYSTASEAGIIFALTPVITLIFAALFLKEKTTIMQKIGVLVSMFGVIYIFYNKGITDAGGSLLGNFLLILSVISIVGYYVLGKKLTQTYTAIDLTVIIVLVAFISFTSMSLISHAYNSTWPILITPLTSTSFIISILYLGILSTLLTSLLTNYALSVIPASTVSIFNNLSPIIAVIGGVVVLGDQLYNFHIIGGILVFIGVFATIFFKKK